MSIIKKGRCTGGSCGIKVIKQYVYKCSTCGYEETKVSRSGGRCRNCDGTMEFVDEIGGEDQNEENTNA